MKFLYGNLFYHYKGVFILDQNKLKVSFKGALERQFYLLKKAFKNKKLKNCMNEA